MEENAQRSVLSAQQNVAEMRTTLEATVIENQVRSLFPRRACSPFSLFVYASTAVTSEFTVADRQAEEEAQRSDGAAGHPAEAGDVHRAVAVQHHGAGARPLRGA